MRGLAAGLALLMIVAACGAGASSTDFSTDDQGLRLRLGTLTQRELDVDADGRNVTAAVEGMNAFAVDLYRSLAASNEGNLVVGPYSVSNALSMIYAGAANETAAEMAAVLHDTAADWHEGVSAYGLSLDSRTAGSPTTWTSANKVWSQPGLDLRDTFLDTLTGTFGSPLAEADFGTRADDERRVINTWVSGETDGMIPELLPPDSLDATTRMVLVNAVALDAPWEFPFDPRNTSDEAFTLLDGTQVDVATMHYDEFLPSGFVDGVAAVELPYGGGALSMVVMVPEDFAAFEADLSMARIGEVLDSIEPGGIHLALPKWSARTHARLDSSLTELGMPSAFDVGRADFSAMSVGGGLFLDRVEHEAFIAVDEDGTRAAAATGGAMAASHGPTVEVDRPFLYLIRDQGAGTILFIGRVVDPRVAASS